MKEEKNIEKKDPTHEEIAKSIGISRQGALLVEKRALEKARKLLKKKGMTKKDFL